MTASPQRVANGADNPPDELDSIRSAHGPDAAAQGLAGTDRVRSVFVYGTLLPGESRAGAWAGHRIESSVPAVARGYLHATNGDYPAMTLDSAGMEVQGELVRVADIDRLLEHFDAVEEYTPGAGQDQLFLRVLAEVRAEGVAHRAWVYVAGGLLELGEVIPSGSWRRHLGRPH